jgi:uncharacterized protein YkwD
MMRVIRVLATVVVALVLALAAPATAATPEQKYAGAAHSATNQERRQEGLKALKQHACLRTFAVRQAKKMATRREIFHQDLGPILRRCDLRSVGENVAYGFSTGRSVVKDGWMESEGHRANILNRGFRLEAIGARKAGGSWYVAQVFGSK